MKCKVCGAESGKYPLCRECNGKKESGEVIKCSKCGQWHYAADLCIDNTTQSTEDEKYLYEMKKSLISKSEQRFYETIKKSLPDGFCVFPQINLASIINRTDDKRFHNELFRNVDFLITDIAYQPKFIIEINDQSHLTPERKERDEKVRKICEEAGIPIMKLWTSYGINPDYIKNKIKETLDGLPAKRVHHFNQTEKVVSQPSSPTPMHEQTYASIEPMQHTPKKSKGCYIATCVYGNYDCPQVWTLRRFRDQKLSRTYLGRLFIKFYYAVSPAVVKKFGKQNWFKTIFKKPLDCFVEHLQSCGIEKTPYKD